MLSKDSILDICSQKIIPQWKCQPTSFPDFLPEITNMQKDENELLLRTYLPLFQNAASVPCYNKEEKKSAESPILKLLHDFIDAEHILNIQAAIPPALFQAFENETMHFVRCTRHFDPALSMDSIWQALRNYFIYSIITDLQGEAQNCCDPIFAYSLLYPYTDNRIDDPHLSIEKKSNYNEFIRQTLSGKMLSPEAIPDQKTYDLLQMIFAYYKKQNQTERGYEISQLLIYMLDAQTESLLQQRNASSKGLTEEDLLAISSYKGGVSVLIDFALSTSSYTETDILFYLSFGFLLQLADDLQDITEDRKSKAQTIMTLGVKNKSLEHTTNKLFHFIRSTFEPYQPKNPRLKDFIFTNCYLMIVCSIISNRKYYSHAYITKLEQYLPVHLSFLKELSQMQTGSNPATMLSMKENSLELIDSILS